MRAGGEPMRRHTARRATRQPPARPAARRQRLDGALRARAAALRARRRRRPPEGRGVRARHTPDAHHTRLSLPRSRRCAHGRGRATRSSTGRRHPPRRRAADVQRRVGQPRHGARRDRRHPLRRMGPRRPGGARRADDAAAPRRPTRSCGSTRSRSRPATRRWRAAWPPRSRTSTPSSRATRSLRSRSLPQWWPAYLRATVGSVAARAAGRLVTVIDGPYRGSKLLVEEDGSSLGSLGDPDLDRVVVRDATASWRQASRVRPLRRAR